MGIPKSKASGPLRVIFTKHATQRIRQRGLDHRKIMRIMYSLPYAEGTWEWDPPGTGMRLVFTDEMKIRTLITAMKV